MNSKIKRISDIIDKKEYRVFSESCDLVYLNNSRLISVGENGFVEKFKKFFKTIWAKIKALIKYLILKFKRNKSIEERIVFSKMKIDRIKNNLKMVNHSEYKTFEIDVSERVRRLLGGNGSPVIIATNDFFFYLKRAIQTLTEESAKVFRLLKEMFKDSPDKEREIIFDAFLLGDFSGSRSDILKNNGGVYKYKEDLDAELDKKSVVKMKFQHFSENLEAGLNKLVDIAEKSLNKAKENNFEKEFKQLQKLIDEGRIEKYFELYGKDYNTKDDDGYFISCIRNIPEAIQGYLNLYDSTVSVCNKLLDLSDECISILVRELKSENGKKIKGGKDVK